MSMSQQPQGPPPEHDGGNEDALRQLAASLPERPPLILPSAEVLRHSILSADD